MGIIRQFNKAFKLLKERDWDKIFVAVDLHDTIIHGCYGKTETFKYFPFAKKALQLMSQDKEVSMIMWSSITTVTANNIYLPHFEDNKIHFEFFNENPICDNTDIACFDYKMYMSVGLDDKFGFNPYVDWFLIYLYFSLRKWRRK